MVHAKQIRWRYALLGFGAALGIVAMVSCSSSKPAPRGGGIAYPVNSAIPPAPPPPPTPGLQLSAWGPFPQPPILIRSEPPVMIWLFPPPPPEPYYTSGKHPHPSEILEKEHGIKLSPADKLIADDCPARPWSKNVPLRECTDNEICGTETCKRTSCGAKCMNDSECGDGLCDRGECKPRWTCSIAFGGPCKKDEQCNGLCFQGLCRSCVSDAECVKKLGIPDAACAYSPRHDFTYCRRREVDF